MRTPIPLYLALLLALKFPLCRAQCSLDVPSSSLIDALFHAGFIPEADLSNFTLQDLTYLCFVRSASDNTTFDQVRVSLLYTYDTATNQSAQVTFSICLSEFNFSMSDVDSVTQDAHFTQNMTREDCQGCLDNSTFASPTYCRCELPCMGCFYYYRCV